MLTMLPGDCREVLKTLPDESVHCCVTSPPYWGLRDYGVTGQLGLEPTPEEYVAEMVGTFREVRRVLRGDGTLWLNLGDSYCGSVQGVGATKIGAKQLTNTGSDQNRMAGRLPPTNKIDGLKAKDLIGVPWRVAFALQNDGWYLRSEIIWHKPNPMPESVTDRPTKSHEQIFLLTKSARYFYDSEAIKESFADERMGNPGAYRWKQGNGGVAGGGPNSLHKGNGQVEGWNTEGTQLGRNKRSVWTIPTSPYSDAHFATFPPKLVEPCILAGTSARGCCAECGAPWERVMKMVDTGNYQNVPQGWDTSEGGHGTIHKYGRGNDAELQPLLQRITTGWQPTCSHDTDTVPATVLDPFAGSGTVGKVALELGRKAILIELNPKYCEMIDRRAEVTLGLPGLA